MFGNVKLRTKLLLGFGAVLAPFMVAIFIYHDAVTSSTDAFRGLMREDISIATRASDIRIAMLQCRQDEKEFLLRKDKKYSDRFDADIDLLKRSARILAATGQQSGDRDIVVKADTISGHTAGYEQAFKELVLSWEKRGLNYMSGLEGKFVERARDLEETFKSLSTADITILLLQIRRHEKNYLLRGEDQWIKATHQNIEKLFETVRKTGLQPEALARIENSLSAYKASFDDLCAEDAKIPPLDAAMRNTVHKIETLTEELQNSAQHSLAAKTEITEKQATSKSRVAITIAAVALCASFFLVFVIIRGITGPVNRIAYSLNESAGEIVAVSSQVSSASQQLAEGTSQQAAAIEETSSSLEEMYSMTKQNAENATQADQLMKQVHQIVSDAGRSMTQVTASMNDISNASEKTQKIIKTIDEIAFQTNLLALNAAVEAARAGEAGAGFAVVANEVRNLAMRAAEAAKNTASMIEGTVKTVHGGSEIVARSTNEFSVVASSISKVGELVAEITGASLEQAQGIEQINKAVSELDKVVQRNAATAEESASASEVTNVQAEHLKRCAEELTALVHGNGSGTKIDAKAVTGEKRHTSRLTEPVADKDIDEKAAASGNDTRKPLHNVVPTGKSRPGDLIPFDEEDVSSF